MAFLCPSKHSKKVPRSPDQPTTPQLPRHPHHGQYSGEAKMMSSAGNIENILRREQTRSSGSTHSEKNNEMLVVRDFNPGQDDELRVRRGDKVRFLFRDNDWLFATDKNGKEGYLPYSHCVKAGGQTMDDQDVIASRSARLHDSPMTHHMSSSKASPSYFEPPGERDVGAWGDKCYTLQDAQPFLKADKGRLIMLFDFEAMDENDLDCRKGEVVTLLNDEDADWFWVAKPSGDEGFVPSNFTRSYQEVLDFVKREAARRQRAHSSGHVNENGVHNGMTHNGMTHNGMTHSGMTHNGMTHNGMSHSGMSQNGMTHHNGGVPIEKPLRIDTRVNNAAAHRRYSGEGSGGGGGAPHQKAATAPHPHRPGGSQLHLPPAGSPHSLRKPAEPLTPAAGRQRMTVTAQFDASTEKDLSVFPGETVFGDLSRQNDTQWIWVYSPRLNSEGFIPASVARV